MNTSLRRGLVATAATALGAGLLAVPAAQADTSRTPQTVDAADWLSSQVTDGVLYNEQYDFVDWGLTLDTLLALDAVGGYNAKVADIADALADDLGSYIGTGGESYAGSTAKALVAVQAADRNTADFGGTDLVGATEARVDGTGRLADASAFGNFANVFGQAFAVKGLHAADSGEAPAATTFLLQQQCADGGFRLDFTATDTSCSGDDAQTDSTAIAVDALLPQSGTPAVATALDEAEAWLNSQQDASTGAFAGGPGTETVNTNSTAVAAVALEKLGQADRAAKAAAWVAERQVTAYSACGTDLDGERGAVGYDDAAIATAEDDGIEVETTDQWRRATAPAVAALQSYDDPSPGPTATFTVTPSAANGGWVAAGGTTTVSVSGLAAAERYCAYTVDGTAARGGRASAEGAATLQVTAPTTAGNQPVVVYGSRDARRGTGTLKVLGARTLGLKLSATKIKRKGTMRVTVSGLAAGEPVKVGYGGKFVATGTASASKTATLSFAVGTATGTRRVSVQGISSKRYASKTFTVVK
ncbi:hypothetical protein [Aeromicrobium sp.]|uniref:hypothetical protein n=1 Tax=Aeromicrobium sp. TaxID=1871063 RepID=UPI0040345F9F